tara:strand:- start:1530 stop:1664 length:135 start_codon:yes stop_codon:yes gene_type:complete
MIPSGSCTIAELIVLPRLSTIILNGFDLASRAPKFSNLHAEKEL